MRKKNIKIAGMIAVVSLITVSVLGCTDKGEEAIVMDYSNEQTADNINEDELDAKPYVFLNNDGSVDKVYHNSKEITDDVSETDNPIEFSISYELDGKKTEPAALAGATGHLKASYSFTNKTDAPFIVATAIVMDSEKCSDIEIDNGKVLEEGGSSIVIGYALPDIGDRFNWDDLEIENFVPDSFVIDADVTDFTQEMSLAVAIPYEDKDLRDKINDKTDEMNNKVDELIDGVYELSDGAKDLYDGTDDIKSGTKTLAKGIKSENEAIDKLADGAKNVYLGVKELDSGNATLVNGLDSVVAGYEGNEGLVKGMGALTQGISACNDGVSKMVASMQATPQLIQASINEIMSKVTSLAGIKDADELNKTVESINAAIAANEDTVPVSQILAGATGGKITSYSEYQSLVSANYSIIALSSARDQISGGIENSKKDIQTLTAGMGSLKEASAKINTGVGKLYDGTKKVRDGAKSLKKGSGDLKNGTKELSDGLASLDKASTKILKGADSLKKGTMKLNDGAKKLSDGTNEMKDETDKLNDVLKAFSDASDTACDILDDGEEYTGDKVIYRISGIDKEGDE